MNAKKLKKSRSRNHRSAGRTDKHLIETLENRLLLTGDFNQDGSLDVADIDLLTAEVANAGNDLRFDVNKDHKIDNRDRRVWVEEIKNTYFGDANLDGEFTSSDFVFVFVPGEYEDAISRNSTWATGDWDGDTEFTSGDFVSAFQSGGYEIGPRTSRVFRLDERGRLSAETFTDISLGPADGKRSVMFDVDAAFDTTDQFSSVEDTFLVYLVDPLNSDETLSDRGMKGTSLFSLSGERADYLQGIVKFDGRTVEIDVSSLNQFATGRLVFQLLNTDSDRNSNVVVSGVKTLVEEARRPSQTFDVSRPSASAGDEVDFSTLNRTTRIVPVFENMRFDSQIGEFRAEVRLINKHVISGREIALEFVGLPDGVQLRNRTGTNNSGNPYINFYDAAPNGGLDRGASTDAIEVVIESPDFIRFSLETAVYQGASNRAPRFENIPKVELMPGSVQEVKLNASDDDGDAISISMTPAGRMPNLMLRGDGTLVVKPTPDDLGDFEFEVHASDGSAISSKTVNIAILQDPVVSTRIAGVVQSTSQVPLFGVPVELGSLVTLTDENGQFTIEFNGQAPSDSLLIRGDALPGGDTYPNVSEKLPFLFGHELYDNFENVIARPIYLPVIDVAQGQTIVPENDMTVSVSLADDEPSTEVFVAAGSLFDQQGNSFRGQLSITEVPRDFTPVALPRNMFPDVVVTIQPPDMVFAEPAPLTFPNRSGWAPGTKMELWSINPFTGDFDDVGDMVVSDDGNRIVTVSGGVQTSSWHYPIREPEAGSESGDPHNADDRTQPPNCGCPKPAADAGSEAELGSGAYLEEHALPTYSSLGVSRGVMLRYDSMRANPMPTVRFSLNATENLTQNVNSGDPDTFRLGARLTITTPSGADFLVKDEHASVDETGEMNMWSIGRLSLGNKVGAAIPVDLNTQPTGVYRYKLESGILLENGETTSGATTRTSESSVIVVNETESPFGAGWGIEGWQRIVQHEQFQDVVLLIDGDGTELMFIVPFGPGLAYQSPPDDFSRLEKIDERFRRTMPDGTVYQFNKANNLISVTDRKGNATLYTYDESDRLVSIIDPAGLETKFAYEEDMVSEIEDPAGRTTKLEHDPEGNLIQIADPDESNRQFSYNSSHLITTEINKRGDEENVTYSAGQFRGSVLADGSTISLRPAASEGLTSSGRFKSSFPPADTNFTDDATVIDGNGSVNRFSLNRTFQILSSVDDIGTQYSVVRNEQNLVTRYTDGRGNHSYFEYDEFGNVVSQEDVVEQPALAASPRSESSNGVDFAGRQYLVGDTPRSIVSGDVDGDGIDDLVTITGANITVHLGSPSGEFTHLKEFPSEGSPETIALADFNNDENLDVLIDGLGDNVSILWGTGGGEFALPDKFTVGNRPSAVAAGDVNSDGHADIVAANSQDDTISVLLSDAAGGFETFVNYPTGAGPVALEVEDINADGRLDVVTANVGDNSISALIGNGDGTFSDPLNTFAVDSASDVILGDVNVDGILDAIIASSSEHSIALLHGHGDGRFAAPILLQTSQRPMSILISDFNGDAQSDIVVATAGEDVEVFLSDGRGSYHEPKKYIGGGSVSDMVALDVNGDLFMDLVATNQVIDRVTVLLGNGVGGLADASRFQIPDASEVIQLVDIDDDGTVDLLSTGRNGNSIALGSGTGSFGTPLEIGSGGDFVDAVCYVAD